MNKDILLYILIVIAVLGLVWTVYGFVKQPYTNAQYQNALAAENTQDICATPAGYTDEEWKQHMGHHPDRYKQCLGGN